jgi:aminoglycoside phosphotransferase (APT) family kinase protein
MTISIDQVMHRIPAWSGRSPVVALLVGGLTNRIYRVDVDGVAYVVRIPGDKTEWLAIDRANELHNTRSAAAAGVSPRVVHQLPDVNVLVLEFIHGETLTVPAMQRPRMPTQIAQVLKQLHAGPRFLRGFNIFRLTRH